MNKKIIYVFVATGVLAIIFGIISYLEDLQNENKTLSIIRGVSGISYFITIILIATIK